MGHSYKGFSAVNHNSTPVLPTPVLTVVGGDGVGWSVVGVTPVTAFVEEGPDGVTWPSSNEFDWSMGGSGGGQDSAFYRVTGLDASSTPVTTVSNVVQIM
jgi:hypothetical protein